MWPSTAVIFNFVHIPADAVFMQDLAPRLKISEPRCVQIWALGQGGQWRRALSIFQGMRLQAAPPADAQAGQRGSPAQPGPRSWGAIIAVCHGARQWSTALRLYREMRAAGAAPVGALMHKVVSACEKMGAWEEADLVRCLRLPAALGACIASL